MYICNQNMVLDATMNTDSENKNFPLSNILKESTTSVFRSLNNECEIILDLKNVTMINSLIIVGSSITGLGFTSLKITGSASTTFNDEDEKDVKVNHKYNVGYLLFDEQPLRFWRLRFTGTGSFVEVSNLFLGYATELIDNGITVGTFDYTKKELVDIKTNKYGQKFKNTYGKQININGNIDYMNQEQKEIFENIVEYHGKSTPFYIIIDENNMTDTYGEYKFTGYFDQSSDITFKNNAFRFWSVKLKLVGVV